MTEKLITEILKYRFFINTVQKGQKTLKYNFFTKNSNSALNFEYLTKKLKAI